MKTFLIVFIIVFSYQFSFGQEALSDTTQTPNQISTDTLEQGEEEMPNLDGNGREVSDRKWSYSANLNGEFRKGNLERSLVSLRGSLDYSNKNSVFGFYTTPSFMFGKTNGLLQERELRIDANATAFYSKSNYYLLAFSVFETSNLRGFNSRIFYGGGLGIRVLGGINKEKAKVKISTTHTILQELTDYINATDINVIRYSARIKFSAKISDSKLSMFSTSFFQPALNKNNLRWNSIFGLNYELSKKIGVNLSYDTSYESVVIEGRKNSDQHLMFGISFSQ